MAKPNVYSLQYIPSSTLTWSSPVREMPRHVRSYTYQW